MENNAWKSQQKARTFSKENDDSNVCVVCFRTVHIYSIGECDHPVCHECSTRMRVLCGRNDCPICRKEMAMVVFTPNVNNFSVFQYRNMKCERRYSMYFENDFVMQAYDELLDHCCNMCEDFRKFRNFQDLKDHIKKFHEQFYCELCIENLKLFTKERRCYTRQTLAQHRRKGDTDDKSHKGHPLCEFCDTRFMDNDELFRHLRRDHYFCHFCDADGNHQYFDDYNALRKHFISDHFVCEEGNCAEERFTSVFRTKLDYQAHYTQIHGHMMSKAQSRQARTVDIAFTVNHRQGQFTDRGPRGALRRRNNDNEEQALAAAATPPTFNVAPPVESIDINCAQDFPSLGNIQSGLEGEGGANKSIAHKLAQQNRFTIRAGRASALNDEQEFPRLGGSGGGTSAPPTTTSVHVSVNNGGGVSVASKGPVVAIQYKCTEQSKAKSSPAPKGPKPLGGILEDFPSLKVKGPTAPSVGTKWGSGCNTSNAPKKAAPAPKPPPPPTKGKIFESGDFPSLAPSSGIPAAPLMNYSGRSSVTIPVRPAKENDGGTGKLKKKKVETKKKPLTLSNVFDDIDPNAPIEDFTKGRVGEYESVAPLRFSNVRCISSIDDVVPSKKTELRIGALQTPVPDAPVPDFGTEDFPSLGGGSAKGKKNKKKAAIPPPPPPGIPAGFANTDMTFTSSFGQKFAISPTAETSTSLKLKTNPSSVSKKSNNNNKNINNNNNSKLFGQFEFILPPNFEQRNKALINAINALCNGHADKFNRFKTLAASFRGGDMHGHEYYEKCRQVMGKAAFLNILPELLALLPDISKQQTVYEAYKKMDGGRNESTFFAVCATCQQVLIADDFSEHMSSHNQLTEEQFPSLGKSYKY